jgi:ferredoxin-NADP reductase/bacterioferritin-associated ferredoxin
VKARTDLVIPVRDAYARPAVACLCANVTHADLADAIASDPEATLESLGATLGCGVQCGSCIPAIREALGQVAWFPARVAIQPITTASELNGAERLIYRVELSLEAGPPYPVVQPGQHVVLRAEDEEGVVERTYTVVSQDVAGRRLTVAIRRKPEGRFTPWLLRDDTVERRIEVSVPGGPGLGTAGYRSAVFFAAGVGVTPAVAMASALGNSATMHLDYSVTSAEDAAFLPRFDNRCKERSGFSYTLRETSVEGTIRQKEVRALAERFPAAKFFICGPQGYVDFVLRALRKSGVERQRIHVELFALSAQKAPSRSFRFKAYIAGALLMLLPLLVLLPGLQEMRPHGHPNVGHEQLKCVACHAETPATLRQTLQAKVKHTIGLRETGAVFGMQAVTTATCTQCHANPGDRHAPHRFLEPRFEKARAETGAQQCVSCHREHSGVRITAANTGYCVSCHADMKVKDDKTSPTHDVLVREKRWDTCLQCHDYHGNHKWRAPLRLVDATTVEVLEKYMKTGPSPFGSSVIKAKQELVQ